MSHQSLLIPTCSRQRLFRNEIFNTRNGQKKEPASTQSLKSMKLVQGKLGRLERVGERKKDGWMDGNEINDR